MEPKRVFITRIIIYFYNIPSLLLTIVFIITNGVPEAVNSRASRAVVRVPVDSLGGIRTRLKYIIIYCRQVAIDWRRFIPRYHISAFIRDLCNNILCKWYTCEVIIIITYWLSLCQSVCAVAATAAVAAAPNASRLSWEKIIPAATILLGRMYNMTPPHHRRRLFYYNNMCTLWRTILGVI